MQHSVILRKERVSALDMTTEPDEHTAWKKL